MSVWRLHVHTREDGIGRYCLDHNVAAMGWSFEDLQKEDNPELKARVDALCDNWEDFVSCAEDRYYNLNESLYRFHDEVKPGDSIWMYFENKYYVARVTSQSHWRFCQEARKEHAANQLINIHWHEAGNANTLVPPIIELAFSDEESTFRKILDYDVEGFSFWLLNALENVDGAQNIWRINLKTGGGNISEYCLENNIAAMGWSFMNLPEEDNPELEEKVNGIKTWEDFAECCSEYYGKVKASPRKFHDDVKIGDIIWMHAEDGYYYFGKVESEWYFNNDPEARKLDASNQRKVHWHKVEDWESIPPELPNNFFGRTFRALTNLRVRAFTLEQLRRLENEK